MEYQFLLPNDELSAAHEGLRAIYLAAQLARERQADRALQLLEEIRSRCERER
jgi:hypothetical protein